MSETLMLDSTVIQVQRMEINRRRDIALGLLPQAARLFETRKELAEQIADNKKTQASKWYWVIGLAGVAGHYIFARDSQFSFGLVVTLMAYAHWLMQNFEGGRLKREHWRCTQSLGDLEVTWTAAVGYTTFWGLEAFQEFGQIDITDEGFQDFWRTQADWITTRVAE